jgi:hypothetical protein
LDKDENHYKKITNNQSSIISDLKKENEKLKKIILTYESKNKKYTKIKKEVIKNKELHHLVNSKIYHPSFVKLDHVKLNNSSIVVNNLNKKNISKEPEKRPSSSELKNNNLQIGFNPSLKKIDPLTITKIFIENTKKTKSNSVSTKRQISRMKSREITTSLSNGKTKEKKNESVIMATRKYKKFINEFKVNTLKKYEEKNKTSHKNLIRTNGKVSNATKTTLQSSSSNHKINMNNNNNSNNQNIFKNHPNIMRRLNKHNVIINNFNSYNYINVYSSSTKEKLNKKKI